MNGVTEASHTTAIGIVCDLAVLKPLYRHEFSNMGLPDSVIKCKFCGGEVYNDLRIVHKDTCVWFRASQWVAS